MPSDQRHDHLVIGLTGPVGSGVSTTCESLTNKGFHRVSISAMIKTEFRRRSNTGNDTPIDEHHFPNWRRQLQDIGNEGRRQSLSYWVEKALEGHPTGGEIVVDGIRNLGEVQYLRRHFSRFFLVALQATQSARWPRVHPDYNGNQRGFLEDDDRDAGEDVSTGQQVDKCVLEADYVLVNETDLGSKQAQKERLYERLLPSIQLMRSYDSGTSPAGARLAPGSDEVHMATAYAQSHMSHCIKRYVGAVIVLRNLPLSLGYNENPVPMLSCREKYHHCFKDDHIVKSLEKMRDVHCPRCGQEMEQLASPWNCTNTDCRANLKSIFFPSRNIELCTAIHAEERAIRSLAGRSAEGATLYVTTFPCFQCSRYIVDAGIKLVVYVEAYPIKEAESFLIENGVNVQPFEGFKARAFNLVFKQAD